MQLEDVKQLLESSLEDCQVEVQGDGSHYQLLIVGKVFDGLNAVKRQQLVYKVLNEAISSGAMHAVVMKTFTPEEWAQQQA